MSGIGEGVATSDEENEKKVWREPEKPVPLHRENDSQTSTRYQTTKIIT